VGAAPGADSSSRGDERDVEILALRHQVLVLERQINRARFTDSYRTILAMLASVFDRRRLAEVFLIVRPETVTRCEVDASRRKAGHDVVRSEHRWGLVHVPVSGGQWRHVVSSHSSDQVPPALWLP